MKKKKRLHQDENCTNRPVCSYVKPLRAGRLLDTPRQAARFVSLVGYEKNVTLGGVDRAEQWSSMHAFLCRNKGVSVNITLSFHYLVECCLHEYNCVSMFNGTRVFWLEGCLVFDNALQLVYLRENPLLFRTVRITLYYCAVYCWDSGSTLMSVLARNRKVKSDLFASDEVFSY